ncbi:MAG: hypothetical protein AB7O68_14615 [Pirellulales bacterium]
MDRFARVILGYHGCEEEFARSLLDGSQPIAEWKPSMNEYDWLGHGIYFWEHSPSRARRWAEDQECRRPDVVGAVIQLGRCFDLLNEEITGLLPGTYNLLEASFQDAGQPLPENRGAAGKLRNLDCLVINDCLNRLRGKGIEYDTVRGAFLEGDAAYPNAGFARETHIQIAVLNPDCILGIFRPNL